MTELRMRIWREGSGQRGFSYGCSYGWTAEAAPSRDALREEMLTLAEQVIDFELDEIFGEREGK